MRGPGCKQFNANLNSFLDLITHPKRYFSIFQGVGTLTLVNTGQAIKTMYKAIKTWRGSNTCTLWAI